MPNTDDDFTLQSFTHHLKTFPELFSAQRWVVGFSGGLDSTVLLHSLHVAFPDQPISAFHINHGLHELSDDWQIQCRQFCQSINVEFIHGHAEGKPAQGDSIESWAREQRYAQFSNYLNKNDVLILAHHQNDQVETVLLRLLRGAGVHGLAAMRDVRSLNDIPLIRPLLTTNRKSLERYAQSEKLNWIKDPSNEDQQFDRNFLRQKILPDLEKRWIGLSKTITRSARLQQEAAELLDELALQDLQIVDQKNITQQNDSLALNLLSALSLPRQRNVIRFWIRQNGFQVPSERRIESILDVMQKAAPDKNPIVKWTGVIVRRYRDRMYISTDSDIPDFDDVMQREFKNEMHFQQGSLFTEKVSDGSGLDISIHQLLTLRSRQGGERIHLRGREHSQSVKSLYQAHAVPPWLRSKIPLIYLGEELIAIPNIGVSKFHLAVKEKSGVFFRWVNRKEGN